MNPTSPESILFKHKTKLNIWFTALVLVISFTLFRNNLYSQTGFKFLDLKNKIQKLKTITFNSNTYISLQEISKILPGENVEISNGIIHSQNYELKSANGSIFVLYYETASPDSQKVLQLQTPAVEIRSEIYIPAQSFFVSLASAGLIEYSSKGNEAVIKLKRSKPEVKEIISKPAHDSINTVPISEKQTEYKPETNVDTGLKFDTTTVKSPNKYIVPKGLIRKELDEKKKK